MANIFKKRLTAPSSADKNYINYKNGGYNTCIAIKGGFVLPNCVGYAQGRVLELLGAGKVNWSLPACNAEDWYDTAKANGMSVGSAPKLGAVICWASGKLKNSADGCGHVAVVEQINADGSIIISESGYNAYEFKTEIVKKPYSRTGYTLLGFIYCGVEFENTVSTTTVDYTKNTIANRFKVKVDTVQKGAYTSYTSACAEADKRSGVVVDGTTGQTIYTGKMTSATTVKTLTAMSYPNYTNGKSYRVRKTFSGAESKGSFFIFRNAYTAWNYVKDQGYHIYDANGKQLD